jgi:hypothetical protein
MTVSHNEILDKAEIKKLLDKVEAGTITKKEVLDTLKKFERMGLYESRLCENGEVRWFPTAKGIAEALAGFGSRFGFAVTWTKFATCEATFPNVTDASAAIDKLAAHGIGAVPFPEVKDLLPDTVYFGLWRSCESEDDLNNFKTVVLASVGKLGGCDCFGLSDHKPIASDFYDVSAAAENAP